LAGDLFETLDDFLFYYNQVLPHQSLDYEKPLEVFLADLPK
jgi:transposase InsO family protein